HGANTATATTNTATFSFDSGNLDATTFQIAAKTGGSVNNLSKGIANIGSTANLTNASTFGAVNMGILSSAGTIGVGSGVNA
ncbi:hypothetical protein JZU54_00390, partial [bacterium]|nr:hypothetical protein [bacterium]